MEEKTQEAQKSGWCNCCTGNDAKCTCFHHGFRKGKLLKIILIFIILGLVFSVGVKTGKRGSWDKCGGTFDSRYQRGGWGNYGHMPMMQYPGWYQNGQWVPGVVQGTTPSATSTTPSAQQK